MKQGFYTFDDGVIAVRHGRPTLTYARLFGHWVTMAPSLVDDFMKEQHTFSRVMPRGYPPLPK